MENMHKPSPEDLAPLLSEATQQGTIPVEQWQKQFIAGVHQLLKTTPNQYRSFGPYWWLVKAALIEAGITQFGTSVDAEWQEKTSYPEKHLGLLAAYAYHDYAVSSGLIYSHEHTISDTDGVGDVYVLADEDVEVLNLGN